MTAKKTAAAKKATPRKVEAEVSETTGGLGEFPLPPEHYYYYPDVLTPYAHTGGNNPDEEQAILSVQRFLGVPETGRFDSATANEVARWRAENDLPYAPLLDAEAWAKMAGI